MRFEATYLTRALCVCVVASIAQGCPPTPSLTDEVDAPPSASTPPAPPPIGIPVDAEVAAPKMVARLREHPFAFYRYIAGPFSTAVCEHYGQATVTMPSVSLHGDAHLEQYAVADDGFGIVDFDDATTGPPVVDWLRFSSSVWIATEFREADARATIGRFEEGYRRGLQDPQAVVSAPEPRAVARIRSKFKGSALDWINGVTSMIKPIDGVDAETMMRARRLYMDSILRQNPDLSEGFFALKAGGLLEMGVGSAHQRKFLVRVEGKTPDPSDDVILEKKEMKKFLTGLCSRQRRADPSRVIDAEAKFSRTPERLLGYVAVDGSSYYVHAWRVHYTELSIKDINAPDELAELAYDFGLQLGRGHPVLPASTESGRTERRVIAEALDKIAPELAEVSRGFAERVMQGHEAYRASSERHAVVVAPREQ